MRLSRWMTLIGVMVSLGCLEVAQHNAIFQKGYAVGDRLKRVHVQETDLAWLNTQVTNLSSPTHLARVVQERQLKLVAWSMLTHEASPEHANWIQWLSGQVAQKAERASSSLVHVAAIDSPTSSDGSPAD